MHTALAKPVYQRCVEVRRVVEELSSKVRFHFNVNDAELAIRLISIESPILFKRPPFPHLLSDFDHFFAIMFCCQETLHI